MVAYHSAPERGCFTDVVEYRLQGTVVIVDDDGPILGRRQESAV